MEDEILKPEQIAAAINNHEYEDLTLFLQETRWDLIPVDDIVPRMKLRSFTKSINRDVRVVVMQYLLDNTGYYFRDNIKNDILIRSERNIHPSVLKDRVAEIIAIFTHELEGQISQMTKFEERDVVKLNRLQDENRKLNIRVKEQEEEIIKLREKVAYYEHPSEYGKHIPAELRHSIFLYSMEYLTTNGFALLCKEPDIYGMRNITCYHWSGHKGLFGYFVDRMNEVLGLRKEGCQINWKPFEKAFINYEVIIKEARNAVSYYTNKTQKGNSHRMSDLFPKRAEDVEKAIEYAREKVKMDSQNQEKSR